MSGLMKRICAAVLVGACMSMAQATVVYSDITNFSGQGFAAGGATNIGGNTITAMAADDLGVLSGYDGRAVNSMSFSVANFNGTAVIARAKVSIYASNGASSGPGTLLFNFTSNALSLGASAVQTFTLSSASALFNLPSGSIWAGLSFDNNSGTTGISAAQLNNLGQGIFDPPTVGSSTDAFFQATSAASFGSNNPAGSLQTFSNGPHANFGWALSVADLPEVDGVPEPSSLMLVLACALALGVSGRRSRRPQA